MTRVVIAGGGPAAVEALLALRKHSGLDVTLVSADDELVYRPLAVGEPFERSRAERFSLARICERCSAHLEIDRLVGVDLRQGELRLALGPNIGYDAALIAVGARAVDAIGGAITFTGRNGDGAFKALLDRLLAAGGEVVFAVPHRVRWSLPLYELALLTAQHLRTYGAQPVSVRVVTPEPEPLAVFGGAVSAEIAEQLNMAGIDLQTSADPLGRSPFVEGDDSSPPVVALPRLVGPALTGLPSDEQGFLHVDDYGRVLGADRIYAAGDATDFPVKQGGIAAEQANVAVATLLADLGFEVEARPLHPVLRGRLDTGSPRRFLRRDLDDTHGESAAVAEVPLWWPGAKIFGRHLAPFLAALARVESDQRAHPVEVAR
jgi:sulfide:quinone oxidoreductase